MTDASLKCERFSDNDDGAVDISSNTDTKVPRSDCVYGSCFSGRYFETLTLKCRPELAMQAGSELSCAGVISLWFRLPSTDLSHSTQVTFYME